MDKLKNIVKEMYSLKVDTPGPDGHIGLPGGARDLLIVGAGPGGMATGIMGGTDGLYTLVVDAQPKPGGQSKFSSRIENFPGFPVGVSAQHLPASSTSKPRGSGAETRMGTRVTGIDYDAAAG